MIIATESVTTRPQCGAQRTEHIRRYLCVFCRYGSLPCPPIQRECA